MMKFKRKKNNEETILMLDTRDIIAIVILGMLGLSFIIYLVAICCDNPMNVGELFRYLVEKGLELIPLLKDLTLKD